MMPIMLSSTKMVVVTTIKDDCIDAIVISISTTSFCFGNGSDGNAKGSYCSENYEADACEFCDYFS